MVEATLKYCILAWQYLRENGLIEVMVEFRIAIKTASSKAVKEFKPEWEAELQQLEIFFAEITTLTGQIILFCFYYWSPDEDPSWMDVFNNFLNEVCDQFDNINMVFSGDLNFSRHPLGLRWQRIGC